ncbi:MAG: NADH-quinone oxidoreductase subunit C [Deltaproteobacteria bacterium]|nr:NADH-quinone oxidoreductase subunit C [Deltaproteobacteria bacterium]
MSEKLLETVRKWFGDAVLEVHSAHGDDTAVIAASRWREVARFLRDDPGCQMNMLVDLCGVDFPDREPRFEVVAHLHSLSLGHRLRIKTRVGDREGDGAKLDSLVPVWPGADWFERETWDLMGIRFVGHPDLRRILLYEEFEGHPLRKDYPADKTQPLVPYREGADVLGKLQPFGDDEGMSFGRNAFPLEHKDQATSDGRSREPS